VPRLVAVLSHRTGVMFSLHAYNNHHYSHTSIIKSITVRRVLPLVEILWRRLDIFTILPIHRAPTIPCSPR
jgi:hypothetical protein